MHGNRLIFSRSGSGPSGRGSCRSLYPVSPYLFSQYPAINKYFLPHAKELPCSGLMAQVLVFDFGFSLPGMIVGAMDTQFAPLTMASNFLATGITGVSDVPPSQGVVAAAGLLAGVQVDPAYLVTIQQTHGGNTWQWMNKDLSNSEGVGTGQHPLMFKAPALLPAGDTVSCIVRNMGNTSLRVQVCLIGGSF